jgi:hypothetical protein
MSTLQATPSFGGRLNNQSYYDAVSGIIRVLRPASSLRIIANHLNKAQFLTPSGLPWNRDRVANFLRNKFN